MQHDPRELLHRAASLIDERGLDYGGIEDNFNLIADIASLRLGRTIHAYEIATIMCAVKSARLFGNPTHIDSRLDLANYEMFAALFAEDYANHAQPDVNYKKRTDLRKAEMVTPPKTEGVNALPKTEDIVQAIKNARVRNTIAAIGEA